MKKSASSRPGRVLTTDAVERLARQLAPSYSRHPAGAAVRRKLQALERNRRFTPRSRQLFEELLGRVGVASTLGISLPISGQPFWFRAGHPLANYQSAPTWPPSVDVLIIGAGLTGASTAYHLGPAVGDRSLHVAVVDRGDPATEASGRNGGSFELLPENSVGLYGVWRARDFSFSCASTLLCRSKSFAPKANGRRRWSWEWPFATAINFSRSSMTNRSIAIFLRAARSTSPTPTARNRECARKSCSPPSTASASSSRSRRKIFEEFDIRTDFVGRFIPDDGTYHPFKYVCGVISAALKSGVELYTRVRGETDSIDVARSSLRDNRPWPHRRPARDRRDQRIHARAAAGDAQHLTATKPDHAHRTKGSCLSRGFLAQTFSGVGWKRTA